MRFKELRGGLEIGALALILVPVAVAVAQIALVQTSDLTRWKGGGFGMYTDPHPHRHRFVWLAGTAGADRRALRLYPLDERLQGHDRWLTRVQTTARESRNFPSRANLEPLHAAVHGLLDADLDDVSPLVPTSNLEVVVIEVGLSADYAALVGTVVSRRTLCTH